MPETDSIFRRRCFSAVVCIGVLANLTGCAKPEKQTAMMKRSGKVALTATQLRDEVDNLAPRFAGFIEFTADKIIDGSDDPEVRTQALLWKARAIPAVNQAIFQDDPLVALLDTWAFSMQMRDYFQSGAGADIFGEFQPIAVNTAIVLEDEVAGTALRASTEQDVSPARDRLAAWAQEHPIEGRTFVRESLARFLPVVESERRRGTFAALSGLAVDLGDLTSRLGLYADQIPKQASWEAQLVAQDYLSREDVEEALDDFAALGGMMTRLDTVLDDFPGLVATERAAILEGVAGERVAVLDAVDRDLGLALDHLSAERAAVFDGIAAERAIILEAMRRERLETIEVLTLERIEILEASEALAEKAVELAGDVVKKTVDHVFLRIVQLLVALLLVGAIAAIAAIVVVGLVRRARA